mgnify:CR=1 FL=1
MTEQNPTKKIKLSEPVLHYFDGFGRACFLRILFAEAGKDYKYNGDINWAPEFKESLPFGQVPLLEDGDFKLAQTHAIAIYLSKKFGLFYFYFFSA